MSGRKTVLIVDDDPGMLYVLANGLSTVLDLFEVVTASNGREAVDVLEQRQVDVLVTDLAMPVMDGFALIAYVTNQRSALPVVVLSGVAARSIDERLAGYGGLRVIRKPANYQDVAKCVLEEIERVEMGQVEGIPLAGVLQLVESERRSCALVVTSGKRRGRLQFESGRLVNAFSDDFGAEGEAAAYDILSWDDTAIEFDHLPTNVRKLIHTPVQLMLIEVAVAQDRLRAAPTPPIAVTHRAPLTAAVTNTRDAAGPGDARAAAAPAAPAAPAAEVSGRDANAAFAPTGAAAGAERADAVVAAVTALDATRGVDPSDPPYATATTDAANATATTDAPNAAAATATAADEMGDPTSGEALTLGADGVVDPQAATIGHAANVPEVEELTADAPSAAAAAAAGEATEGAPAADERSSPAPDPVTDPALVPAPPAEPSAATEPDEAAPTPPSTGAEAGIASAARIVPAATALTDLFEPTPIATDPAGDATTAAAEHDSDDATSRDAATDRAVTERADTGAPATDHEGALAPEAAPAPTEAAPLDALEPPATANQPTGIGDDDLEAHVQDMIAAVERLTVRARAADEALAAVASEVDAFRQAQRRFDHIHAQRERRRTELEAFREDVARLARELLGRVDGLFDAMDPEPAPDAHRPQP